MKPTKTGFYWYLLCKEYAWDIAKVWLRGDQLMVEFPAHNWPLDEVEDSILWVGPIPVPPLPETEDEG